MDTDLGWVDLLERLEDFDDAVLDLLVGEARRSCVASDLDRRGRPSCAGRDGGCDCSGAGKGRRSDSGSRAGQDVAEEGNRSTHCHLIILSFFLFFGGDAGE